MKENVKKPMDSLASMTVLVLPNDTNVINNLMGGRMMHWMDIVAAISAQRHSNCISVTASVDHISFHHPINLGNVVTLTANVTRAFSTSMEVRIFVEAEDIPTGKKRHSNTAYFTFVALNEQNKPEKVPCIEPQTIEEKEQYESALRRRQMRLLLDGKLKTEDVNNLLEVFKFNA